MRSSTRKDGPLHTPQLLDKTTALAAYLKTLSAAQLVRIMHISPALGEKAYSLLADWNADPKHQSAAMDSFVGDIYSGLRASTLTEAERTYADEHLRILSGLYGILRPLDGVCPYRLEMGYRLPDPKYANLYDFWGDSIAACLPQEELVINLAALEYTWTVIPYIDKIRVVAPKFLTIDPKTEEPTFVVVHTKIARGAYARWLITSRVDTASRLHEFADIGYRFDSTQSTPQEPVFICKEFAGKGLSMRLQN